MSRQWQPTQPRDAAELDIFRGYYCGNCGRYDSCDRPIYVRLLDGTLHCTRYRCWASEVWA